MQENAGIRSGLHRFLKMVLTANGIGDIALGLGMVFWPGFLARLLKLDLNTAGLYLAGGWGVAAISFGALRVCAGMSRRTEIGWFAAVFGLVDGPVLAVFGLALMALTPLGFAQVGLSTVFALVFAAAYAFAFLLKRREDHRLPLDSASVRGGD